MATPETIQIPPSIKSRPNPFRGLYHGLAFTPHYRIDLTTSILRAVTVIPAVELAARKRMSDPEPSTVMETLKFEPTLSPF